MQICLDQRNGTGCGLQNRDSTQFCQQCGRPLRYSLQLRDPGAVAGSYRIVRLIGYGGFGAVYEAEDTRQPGNRVALKETFDPDQIQSFQGEFVVLSRLHHAHLPRYYATFEDGGNGYLAMEFVPGQSLQDVLDKQKVPLLEAQVLGYALQLCDALTYLHSQNPPIIHRDIKPANVRLTPEGLIKLVDFGLVKEGTEATRSSRRAVTPAYAPLEQWGMGGQHTDQRSDIYSLGATLYHLLTGQAPPAATDRIAHTPDPLVSPRSLNSAVSQHMADAVMAAVALRLQDRPSAAAILRLALTSANQPLPVQVQAASLSAPVASPPQIPVPARMPAAPAVLKPRNPISFDWVTIPAGEFLMGSDKRQNKYAADDEEPQHRVYLDEFQIARTPVTNLQYKAFMDATRHSAPSLWGGGSQIPVGKEQHQVVFISWDDAQVFCSWAGVRLPTEAEWEKVARGTDGRIWPWGNRPPDETQGNFTSVMTNAKPVGHYPQSASPYGVLDMAGYPWEWVADWYDADYYSRSPERNPSGPANGDFRVVRGGPRLGILLPGNAVARWRGYPNDDYSGHGFRVVWSASVPVP